MFSTYGTVDTGTNWVPLVDDDDDNDDEGAAGAANHDRRIPMFCGSKSWALLRAFGVLISALSLSTG